MTSAMGQIVRRKRKGRPPKPDLSRRSPSPPPEEFRNVRRSHRRRNVRYSSFIDYDDFIDDDDFELDREDEEVLRGEDDADEDVELSRGRKVKLVVKLSRRRGARGRRAREACDSGSEAGGGATEGEEEVEDEAESRSEGKVLKKRRIRGREEEDDDLDDTYQEDDYGDVEEEEVRACRDESLGEFDELELCSGVRNRGFPLPALVAAKGTEQNSVFWCV